MTTATKDTKTDGASRLIDSVQDAEKSSLEAVRKFVDAVDGAFPDIGDDGPRRKIIDSAFKMVEQLLGASNDLARNMMKVTEDALGELRADDTKAKK
jgi:hypothetical protein